MYAQSHAVPWTREYYKEESYNVYAYTKIN